MSGTHEHKQLPEQLTAAPVSAPVVEQNEIDCAPVPVAGLALSRSGAGSAADPLGGSAVPEAVQATLSRRRGGGSQLPTPVARSMGELMGADFSGVRVHSDGEADQLSRSVQATAFTYGSDIYFSRGTYAPGSQDGQRLLAHELAHVAQGQGGGGVARSTALIGPADDPAEHAADEVADGVMRALRGQNGRVDRQAELGSASDLGALQRQASRVESTTVRRWNPWKWLFGGSKAPTTPPVAPAVAGPVIAAPPASAAAPAGRNRALAVSAGSAAASVGTAGAAATSAATAPPSTATPTTPAPTTPAPTTPVAPVTTPPAPTTTPTATTAPAVTETPATETPATTPTATAPTTAPTVTAEATTAAPVAQTPAQTPAQSPPPAPKSAKVTFAEALTPDAAPASPAEARGRMVELRTLLGGMSVADRETIYKDRALLMKGRTFVGSLEYMSLVAALGMQVARKPPAPGQQAVGDHLSGAQADAKIAEFVEDYPHIKPYLAAATSAGKKGDGFVATVSQEDWELIYPAEFSDPLGERLELTTNAFAAGKNADKPAILHADRGTPSTAIHESMHRYSTNNVLTTYRFNFNEGVTEYFTRMLTDRNANAAKAGGPSRDNYNDQFNFIRDMIVILGDNQASRETVLAEMYFKGQINELPTRFKAKWKAANAALTPEQLDAKWTAFETAIKSAQWATARANMPPTA